MSKTSVAQPKGRSSRRHTLENGLPRLAAQLPPDFACPSHVNAFIFSLITEVVAGRVDSRRAAVLGYLSQLAIQTLPLLRLESGLDREPFTFITNIPPPGYSRTTSSTPDANPEAEIGEKMAQGMSQKEARQVVEGRQT